MSEVRGVKAREAAAGRVSAVEAAPALQGANWPPPGSPAEAYAGRLSPLLSEALAARQLPPLVDALTAGLALIMIEHGSWAAISFVESLGRERWALYSRASIHPSVDRSRSRLSSPDSYDYY